MKKPKGFGKYPKGFPFRFSTKVIKFKKALPYEPLVQVHLERIKEGMDFPLFQVKSVWFDRFKILLSVPYRNTHFKIHYLIYRIDSKIIERGTR